MAYLAQTLAFRWELGLSVEMEAFGSALSY